MKTIPKTNPKCPHCDTLVIKIGFRKNDQRTVQRYLCKQCNYSFTAQPTLQQSKTYPLKTILDAISAYNLGTPLRRMSLKPVFVTFSKKVAVKETSLKHSVSPRNQIPSSAIHNWIKNINLPMNRLRNKLTQNPIKKQCFHSS